MDVKACIWTLLFVGLLTRVDAALRCIECTHISWKELYDFESAGNVYHILKSKYNPACAQENPLDRDLFMNNQNNYQAQQQQNNLGGIIPQYDVGETICQSNTQSATGKCHYIYGNATISLPSYKGTMVLNIHVRDCENLQDERIENRCYLRTGQFGTQNTIFKIQSKLTFLSTTIQVTSFSGQECYCGRDLCYNIISSARSVVASSLSILLALVSFVMLL